ncbi:hypothetical protein CJU89_0142 [Yarrowia sp. B02]|nr:hypothetical protein CJU89_0142 [Yarrowia sp. B02]
MDDHPSILHRTVLSSPVIEHIFQCRNADGVPFHVILRTTSLVIANQTHTLPARLLSACVLEDKTPDRGSRDHLLMCMSSGELLLVRVYETGATPQVLDALSIFPRNKPNLSGIGGKICVDASSTLAAIGSFSEFVLLVEIRPIGEKPKRYFKEKHIVSSAGTPATFNSPHSTVLDYCFNMIVSTEEDAGVYLSALFANERQRLTLETYLWRPKYPVKTVSKLPLPIMDLPVFLFFNDTVSGSVILACPKNLYLVKFNDMLSGVTTFPTCTIDSFPVAHYRSEDAGHVYISCEDGSIIEVIATNSSIRVEKVVKTDVDLGKTFVLEEADDESYLLGYGGDASDGRLLQITKSSTKSFVMETIASFPNWAPASDIEIIHGNMYVASGVENTGALTQLNPGSRITTLYSEESDQYDTIMSVTFGSGLFPVSYIVVSSPIRSKIRQTMYKDAISEDPNPRFWDLAEDCGFEFNQKTLDTGFTQNGLFVQICPNLLVLTDLAGNRSTLEQSIVMGSVGPNNIIATVGNVPGNDRNLSVYRTGSNVKSEGFELVKSIPLDTPVTLLKVLDDHIVVGTHETINFYDIEDLTAVSTDLPFTPCDMFINSAFELLIGCRTGHLLYCSFTSQGEVTVNSYRQFGDTPVRITSLQFQDYILVASDNVYILNLVNNSPPLQIHNDDATNDMIIGECPVFIGEASPDTAMSVFACFLTPGQLKLVDLELAHSVVEHKIELGKTPRRLLYLDDVDLLVVTLLGEVDPDSLNHLAFINLSTRAVVSPNIFMDRRKPGGVTVFSRKEVIFCMCEWRLSLDSQEYRYLVTGSGYTTSSKGRLVILSYKVKNGEVSLGKQAAWTVPEPVFAVCQLSKNTLVYSTGRKISVAKFMGPSIEYKSCPEFEFPSKVVKLTVTSAGEIIASTMNNGVIVLTFEDDRFSRVAKDSVYRSCLNHGVSGQLIAVADKERCVSFLARDEGITLLKPMGKVFLPSFVSKLLSSDHKPIWRKQPAQMFQNPSILCLSMSGEITKMYIMTKQEREYWDKELSAMKREKLKDSLLDLDSEDFMEDFSGPINSIDTSSSSYVSFPTPISPSPTMWSDFDLNSTNIINGTSLFQMYYGTDSPIIDALNEM